MSGGSRAWCPDIGQVIAGRYRLERQLGEGGMGVVFAATHLVTREEVAIKLMLPQLGHLSEAVQRFFGEAQAASRIRHPNVIDVRDAGIHEGAPYIAMELLRGEDLAAKLAREGPLDVGLVRDLLLPVLDALEAAHAAGIVHRDLKPENIFLEEDPRSGGVRPKVLDFGISKLASPSAPSARLTQTGAMLGTPLYMAPEQLRGARDVDARADLYSLGVVFFELLTGRVPHEAESFGELVITVVTKDAPPVSSLRPGLGVEVDRFVAQLLARDGMARFPDVHAVRAALVALPAVAASPTPEGAAPISRHDTGPLVGGRGGPHDGWRAPASPAPLGGAASPGWSGASGAPASPAPLGGAASPGWSGASGAPAVPSAPGGMEWAADAPWQATPASRGTPRWRLGAIAAAMLGLGAASTCVWFVAGRSGAGEPPPVGSEPARDVAHGPAEPTGSSPREAALTAARECEAHLSSGELDSAATAAARGLELDPTHVQARACAETARERANERAVFDRGTDALRRGDGEAAYVAFEELAKDSELRGQPEVIQARTLYVSQGLESAQTALERGDSDAASRHATAVLATPDITAEHRREAAAILRSAQRGEAPAGDPRPGVGMGTGMASARQRRTPASMMSGGRCEGGAVLRECDYDAYCVTNRLGGCANDPRSMGVLVEAHKATGNRAAAERVMREIVRRFPTSPHAARYHRQLMVE